MGWCFSQPMGFYYYCCDLCYTSKLTAVPILFIFCILFDTHSYCHVHKEGWWSPPLTLWIPLMVVRMCPYLASVVFQGLLRYGYISGTLPRFFFFLLFLLMMFFIHDLDPVFFFCVSMLRCSLRSQMFFFFFYLYLFFIFHTPPLFLRYICHCTGVQGLSLCDCSHTQPYSLRFVLYLPFPHVFFHVPWASMHMTCLWL